MIGPASRWGPVAAVAIVLALGLFFALGEPGSPTVVAVEDVSLTLAAGFAAFMLVRAGLAASGAPRAGWLLVGAGAALYALGMAEWTRRQVFLHVAVPTPSIADAGFLGYAAVAGVGLLFLQSRSAAGRIRLLLDAATVGLCVLLVSLVLIILPIVVSDGDGLQFADAIIIAYPISDVVMFSLAVTLAAGASHRDQRTFALLALGVACIAFADSAYAYLLIHGRYATGVPSDTLWIAGQLLLAFAGMRAIREPVQQGESIVRARLSPIMPALAMGFTLAALLGLVAFAEGAGREVHHPVVEGSFVVLLGLLVVRNAVAAADNAALVGRLAASLSSTQQQVKERTAALERSNADLRHFATAASHDLQEPLRTIRSYTQLVERRYADKLDADGREFLRYASDAAERMSRLIEGLLAYTRIDITPPKPRATPSARALEEAQANLAASLRETGAMVHVETPLPVVLADPAHLLMLFQNLVGNSIKYRGGETPVVRVSAVPEEGAWRFCLRDNGIGIDPEFHDRVFGIFQRLHAHEDRPGSGIGLAVCRRIVERHGGRMWVESARGQGAAFYFTLPRKETSS